MATQSTPYGFAAAFRPDNTEGFTTAELAAMNDEYYHNLQLAFDDLLPDGVEGADDLTLTRIKESVAEAVLRRECDRYAVVLDTLEDAARECDRHAAFLKTEAHNGGNFDHLMTRALEANYLAARIRRMKAKP